MCKGFSLHRRNTRSTGLFLSLAPSSCWEGWPNRRGRDRALEAGHHLGAGEGGLILVPSAARFNLKNQPRSIAVTGFGRRWPLVPCVLHRDGRTRRPPPSNKHRRLRANNLPLMGCCRRCQHAMAYIKANPDRAARHVAGCDARSSQAFTPACSPTRWHRRLSFGQWSNTLVGTWSITPEVNQRTTMYSLMSTT